MGRFSGVKSYAKPRDGGGSAFKAVPYRLRPMPVCAICGGVSELLGTGEYRCVLEKVRWTDDRLTVFVRKRGPVRIRDPESGKFVSTEAST